jgi:hypothetical protein
MRGAERQPRNDEALKYPLGDSGPRHGIAGGAQVVHGEPGAA